MFATTLKKIGKGIKHVLNSPQICRLHYMLTYPASNRNMRIAIDRFKRSDRRKPKPQMKKEVRWCREFWGCHPFHYIRHGLYDRDANLTKGELLDYIPEFFFYAFFLPYHNKLEYLCLMNDKNMTDNLLRSFSIQKTPTLCKLVRGNIYSADMCKKTFSEIEEELDEHKYRRVFAKPARGHGGNGILIFERNSQGQYKTEPQIGFDEKFLHEVAQKGDWIIEPGIEQHPLLSGLYSNSTNTIRALTDSNNGKSRLLAAYLRIGAGGNKVDNVSQGGVLVKIDIDTGVLDKGFLTRIAHRHEGVDRHPNTSAQLKGLQIPQWEKIVSFLGVCATKISPFRYLGWDIALTKEGDPVVIEANNGFALDSYQCFGGLRRVFEIEDPRYYWEKSCQK